MPWSRPHSPPTFVRFGKCVKGYPFTFLGVLFVWFGKCVKGYPFIFLGVLFVWYLEMCKRLSL